MDAIQQLIAVDGRVGWTTDSPKRNDDLCLFPGCINRAHARGVCTGHYNQWQKGMQLRPLMRYNKVEAGVKLCPDCGERKPVDEFGKKLNYQTSICDPCSGIRLRMKTFGLSRQQVVEMLANGCEACGDVPSKTKHIHIDHDHATGKVRGVLCHACNTTLGLLNEDAGRLRALAAYIERHQS